MHFPSYLGLIDLVIRISLGGQLNLLLFLNGFQLISDFCKHIHYSYVFYEVFRWTILNLMNFFCFFSTWESVAQITENQP